MIEDAVERGELYNPQDADDTERAINDPSSEDGPEIERKVGIDTDDDDTDDDDGGSPQQATNGDSPDSTATSESGDAETSPSENGNSPGVDADSPDGQTAATSSAPDADAGTSQETVSDGGSSSPALLTITDPPEMTDKTAEELQADDDDLKELEASIKADPPDGSRVKEAMATAIEFFHNSIDEEIPENIEWNEANPDAGYRKPETAREYYRDPEYDDDPAAARSINPRVDIATETDGPSEFDIAGTASHRLSKDTGINDSSNDSSNDSDNESSNDSEQSEAVDALAEDATETVTPYNIETRDNRGWSPETIEQKKLGWAPRDMDSLREHLKGQGFTQREMLATGLFNLTNDGKLLPFIQARYVLPYFDDEGNPVYVISRSIDTDIPGGYDGEGPDFHSNSKYAKPKDEAHLKEPIYGTQTIEEGEPLVITEGIADAITAHEHGIPCISPVTKQFKKQHYSLLEDLILDANVPRVYIIQDADPPASSVTERYTADYQERYRNGDDDADKKPKLVDRDGSDLHKALTAKQKGPGFEGALRTAMHLDAVARRGGSQTRTDDGDEQTLPASKWDDNDAESDTSYDDAEGVTTDPENPIAESADTPERAFETRIVELPRYGQMKYDFDDYLSDNMGQLDPPAMWVYYNIGSGSDIDTPDWIDNLISKGAIDHPDITAYDELPDERTYPDDVDEDSEGTTHPIRVAPGYHPNPKATNITLPPIMTMLNFLPTIGPNNGALSPAVANSSSGTTPGGFGDDIPDDRTSNSNDLFNLHFEDVSSYGKGFRGKSPFGHTGESEDYFCVISDEIAYCHKRDSAYTPGTAVLVFEGERRADNPGGSFSPKEKFVFWRYVRKHGILECTIPKDALLYYAISNDIASQDDVVEREGKYGTFETLPVSIKCDTLAAIGENHSFDIKWENYDSVIQKPDTNGESGAATSDDQPGTGESGSAASTESKAGQSAASGEQSPAGQSGASDGSESATSRADESSSDDDSSQPTGVKIGGDTSTDEAATGDDQPTDDDDDEMPPETGDVEGLAASSDLFDDVEEVGSDNDSDASDAAGGSAESDGTTTFHTYEEPSETGDEFDVDVEAVSQFTSEFCLLESDDDAELKTHKGTLLNAFNTWANLNDIELDELGEDVWINHRKGNLKQVLEHLHDLSEGKYTVAGERAPGFGGIELSEVGKELLDIDTE